jgi:hypothetical protein
VISAKRAKPGVDSKMVGGGNIPSATILLYRDNPLGVPTFLLVHRRTPS